MGMQAAGGGRGKGTRYCTALGARVGSVPYSAAVHKIGGGGGGTEHIHFEDCIDPFGPAAALLSLLVPSLGLLPELAAATLAAAFGAQSNNRLSTSLG
ncbi:hypothetical protein TYRP_013359 [Tyrophagus putrescentiae]|nr:hypothetical protein TYRP_013359 [Tyrophagus putrescentiae]